MNHKTSFKAKTIFFLIPIIFIAFVELTYALFTYIKSSTHNETAKLPAVIEIPLVYNDKNLDDNYLIHTTKPLMLMPFHRPEPNRCWGLKPGYSFSFRLPEKYIVNYKINSLGFRGDEFQAKKPEGKKRIICAGDSSTFGFFVNIADTYPSRLQQMIENQTIEKNTEVINAGVWCYSSFQGGFFIENDLIKLEPDVLIYSYGFNDSDLMDLSDSQKVNSPKDTGFGKYLRKMLLYKYMNKLIGSLSEMLHLANNPKSVPRVNLFEYRSNLEKVVSICKKSGIKLVFLPISVPVKYLEVMQEVARENDIILIETEKILTAYYYKFLNDGSLSYKNIRFGKVYRHKYNDSFHERFGSEEMLDVRRWNYVFMDHCHPTPVGYKIIAETIFNTFVKHGLFTSINSLIPPPPPTLVPLEGKTP
jgi:lysophospholipase L1-like esterase